MRVEVGMHTGFINKLAVDPSGSYAVSVSEDGTARLWLLGEADLTLLKTFRVPIVGQGSGQIYAAAFSSDLSGIYIGGRTGSEYTRIFEGQSVRLTEWFTMAIDTGRIRNRECPGAFSQGRETSTEAAVIDNIRTSPSGTVALALSRSLGSSELQIYRESSSESPRLDPGFSDRIFGMHFSASGDLAVSSLDGSLKVYESATDYAKHQVFALSDDEDPMHVRFSPNGKSVLVGYESVAAIDVIDLESGNRERLTAPPRLRQRALQVVEWSADGRYIVAGGEPEPGNPAYLVRWSRERPMDIELLEVGDARFSDLHRLPDGGFLFSTAAPSIGRVSREHKLVWSRNSDILDTRKIRKARLEDDGSSLAFDYGSKRISLTLLNDSEQLLTRTPAHHDYRAAQDAASVDIPLPLGVRLESNESVVSSLDLGSRLILGTEHYVRCVESGREYGKFGTTFKVQQLVGEDGVALFVAMLSDGSFRWVDTNTCSEVFGAFVHANLEDWVVWTPSGYYKSSLNGDNYIGWLVNRVRGTDITPAFYRAIQFERDFFRPDIVDYTIARGGWNLTEDKNASFFDISRIAEIAPPEIILMPTGRTPSTVDLSIAASSESLPMLDYSVYVNGIPIRASMEGYLRDGERHQFSRTLQARLLPEPSMNTIRVEVNNGRTLGVSEIRVGAPGGLSRPTGDLYLLAIGVNEFDAQEVPALRFAANDAQRVVSQFQSQIGQLFGNVHTKSLVNGSKALDTDSPTRENILRALEFIQPAKAQDTVIVFLASHGLSDAAGNFYFVPQDADGADFQGLAASGTRGLARVGDSAGLVRRDPGDSLVDWRVLFSALRAASGYRLLIIDTCESENARGTFDVHSLAKRSLSSHFALLTASRGDEPSQESAEIRQGVFTYSLLEALQKPLDSDGDGLIGLAETHSYLTGRVEELRPNKKYSQTPQMMAPGVLEKMPLGVAAPR